MSNFFKEYRCEHCRKLFFKGDLKHCTIEIKCRNCKNISTIKGVDCKFLLSDQKSPYKRNDKPFVSKKVNV